MKTHVPVDALGGVADCGIEHVSSPLGPSLDPPLRTRPSPGSLRHVTFGNSNGDCFEKAAGLGCDVDEEGARQQGTVGDNNIAPQSVERCLTQPCRKGACRVIE